MSEFGGDPLAIATVLIRPDTTKFRATLEAELKAATAKPIVVPVAPISVGGTAAGQLQATGAAAGAATKTLKAEAKAAREAAVAHEQLARGAGATVLSLTGVRGATLAASGPFLAGAAAITLAVKSVHEFSAEAEAAARVEKVFGTSSAELEHSAHGLADSFGLSASAALKFEGAIGEVFKNVGVAADLNAKLSESLVKLAVDSAAFNNVPTEQVLRAIQLGLSGNLRGLRQFIPGITAAAIAEQALADTGKKTKQALTEQNLVIARAEIIQARAANQAGTFAERSGDLAAQSKILQSNLANLAASIGGPLVTAFRGFALGLNSVFDAAHKLESLHVPFLSSGGGQDAFNNLLLIKRGLDLADTAISDFQLDVKLLSGANLNFNELLHLKAILDADAGAADHASLSFQGLIGFVTNFQALVNNLSLDSANAQLNNLGRNLLDLQFIGASSAKQIANLQKQIAADQAIIANPRASKQQQDQARRDRNSAQAQIKSIQAADKATSDAAKAAAAAAKKNAQQAAKDQLSAQDQALLTAQAIAQGNIEIAKARAANTKTLTDDLAQAKKELVLINQHIVQAQQIHDANLRKQTIQSLTLQSVQVQGNIAALQRQAAAQAKAAQQAAAQARANRREAALASVDADIEFAQITKNTSAEIRAHQAKIRLLTIQINNASEGSVKWKQLRNERAREEQAIKELKGQTDKNNRAAEALAFSILQEQQGFVGKLLSNLLPTSAVAGTVGGAGAISTPTGPGAADFATAVHTRPPASTGPGPAVSAAAQVSQGAGGATTGQMATLIILMRQLVGIVGGKKAAPRHPEATYQTYTSSTEMAHPLG